jgi:hypothetical protein
MKCEGVLRVVKERKKIIKRKMDKSIICVRWFKWIKNKNKIDV